MAVRLDIDIIDFLSYPLTPFFQRLLSHAHHFSLSTFCRNQCLLAFLFLAIYATFKIYSALLSSGL
jgi:hypothetical protein